MFVYVCFIKYKLKSAPELDSPICRKLSFAFDVQAMQRQIVRVMKVRLGYQRADIDDVQPIIICDYSDVATFIAGVHEALNQLKQYKRAMTSPVANLFQHRHLTP